MSVINDMLRDLDARKAPAPDLASGAQLDSIVQPQKSLPMAAVFVTILVLVCVIALAFAWPAYRPVPSIVVAKEVLLQAAPLQGQSESETAEESVDKKAVGSSTLSNKAAVVEKAKSVNLAPVKANKPERQALSQAAPAALSIVKEVAKTVVITEAQPETQTNVGHEEKTEVQTKAPASSTVTLSPEAKDQQQAKQAQAMFEQRLDQGQAREAYRELYLFIEHHDVDGRSRAVLASRLLAERRYAEAGDVLLAGNIEHDSSLRQIKARWLMATNNKELALHVLESSLPNIADDKGYYALLASYYQQMRLYDKAVDTYSVLLENDGGKADWWAGMAIALDRLKRYQNAVLAYKQALALPGLKPSLAGFAQQRLKQITP